MTDLYFVCAGEGQCPEAERALAEAMPTRLLVLPNIFRKPKGSTKFLELANMARNQPAHVWRLLRLCAGRTTPTVLVCADHHYAALLVARLLVPLRRNVRVYLFNFYLHELGANPLVKALLRMLLSSRVGMLAQAPDEVDYFRSLCPQMQIDYTPFALPESGWYTTPAEAEAEAALGDYVFVGGRSNRDHDAVLRVAATLPDIPFVLAGGRRYRLREPIPTNVQAFEDIPKREFHSLLAGSRCVVLSLKANTGSSGQMVALAAMRLGKLVLYSDMPAVSQYFDAGKVGVSFRPGDHMDLRDKLVSCYKDVAACRSTGAAARQHALAHFGSDSFHSSLAAHISEWMARSRA